jgi:cob(I)alamin adenosyltransferase
METKIYTRTGDKGQTGLVGGRRVDKDDVRIEALGELDEANSTIGLLRSKLEFDHDWQAPLKRIQTDIMDLMAHVATPSDVGKKPTMPLPEDGAEWAEKWMDEIENAVTEASDYFLLPGGNEISALCHVVRTQMRRAERRLVSLNKQDPVDTSIMIYINRLSDLFFKLARLELDRNQLTEEKWNLFVYSSRKKPN